MDLSNGAGGGRGFVAQGAENEQLQLQGLLTRQKGQLLAVGVDP